MALHSKANAGELQPVALLPDALIASQPEIQWWLRGLISEVQRKPAVSDFNAPLDTLFLENLRRVRSRK